MHGLVIGGAYLNNTVNDFVVLRHEACAQQQQKEGNQYSFHDNFGFHPPN